MTNDIFSVENEMEDEDSDDLETWDSFEGYDYVDPKIVSSQTDPVFDEYCDEEWE